MIKAHFVTVLTKQLLLKHNITGFKVEVCNISNFERGAFLKLPKTLVGQTLIGTKNGKLIQLIQLEKSFVKTHNYYSNYQNILHEVAHAIVAVKWGYFIANLALVGKHGLLWRVIAWRIGYKFSKEYYL